MEEIPGCDGRMHHSTLVNLDESYKFLRMLGLLHSSSGFGKQGDSNVADGASEFNRLLQTGWATFTTKTCGSYGNGNAPTISMGLSANAHPSVCANGSRTAIRRRCEGEGTTSLCHWKVGGAARAYPCKAIVTIARIVQTLGLAAAFELRA